MDHFGFRDRIRFNTEVERVEPAGDGGWDVTLDDGTDDRPTTRCSWPTATTGTRAGPSRRSRAEFAGDAIHAHHYESREGYEGKNVLVLGIGNSASDIAVETSRVVRA